MQIVIYVLFVFTHVNSGSHLHTQEFFSLETCQYAAKVVYQQKRPDVESAYCIQK